MNFFAALLPPPLTTASLMPALSDVSINISQYRKTYLLVMRQIVRIFVQLVLQQFHCFHNVRTGHKSMIDWIKIDRVSGQNTKHIDFEVPLQIA